MSSVQLPRVSVIIPFLNNSDEVIAIKRQLMGQTYPREKFDLIFIDNGSEKKMNVPEDFWDGTILVHENRIKQSPYSARNRGIEQAGGEVLVFIDANSRPAPNWLEEGIRFMLKGAHDIIAGRVDFDLGPDPYAANIVDSVTSINMKKAVAERGVAYTANLFVTKQAMEKTGYFEEGTRSGGDVRWSMKAQKKGFKIEYCEQSVVFKKPRDAKQLFKKKMRTGKGYFYTWRQEEEKEIWFYNFLRSLKPPGWSKITALNPDRKEALKKRSRWSIWGTFYLLGIVEQIAFMAEYLRYNLGSQRDADRRERMEKLRNETK